MKRNFSKALAVIVAALMLFAALPFAVSAESSTVNGVEVSVGEYVTVSWELNTATPVVNAGFEITYPADLLELVDQTDAVRFPVLSKGGLMSNTTEAGHIYVGATNASTNDSDLYSFSGGADLAVFKFRVTAAGAAEVKMIVDFIGGKNSSGISGEEVDLVSGEKVADGVTITPKTEIAESTTLVINEELEAEIDEYVTFDVMIKSNYLVNDIQGSVVYNSDYLELVSDEYPVITNMVSNPDQENLVEFATTKPEGPYDFTTEASAAKMTFKVLKGGSTEIVGNIEVLSGNNPDNADEDIVLISKNMAVDSSTTLNYVLNVRTEPPKPAYAYGDVNHDEAINAGDATLMLQRYAGIIGDNYENYDPALADVNADGNVDAGDATLALQKYAGIVTVFPVETAA